MSNKIKMSDVLPVLHDEMVCVRADRKNVVLDFKRTTGLPLFEDGVAAICHAINNHDRLVEENNRLREALRAVVMEFDSDYLDESACGLILRINKELDGDK